MPQVETLGSAVPGTVVSSGSLITPGGDQGIPGTTGPPGLNAYSLTTALLTVPAIGQSATVTLANTSWLNVGDFVSVQSAGGGGQSAVLQVTAISGNQITLLNPPQSGNIPPASSSTAGLLNVLSGNVTDYVAGDNACHNLVAALTQLLVPTGAIIDYAGASAPAGFLTCDGSAVSRTIYPNLYAALGGASSPWGQGDGATTFNVPDLRGKSTVGTGQGSGLTNRVLGATGGEENHVLVTSELAVHAHANTAAQAAHTHTDSGHIHGLTTMTSQTGIFMTQASQNWNQVSANTTTGYANLNSVAPTITVTNANAGSGSGHNNMQPFATVGKIIKT